MKIKLFEINKFPFNFPLIPTTLEWPLPSSNLNTIVPEFYHSSVQVTFELAPNNACLQLTAFKFLIFIQIFMALNTNR